ncbi:MAG TPA: CPBP family glutamic-type intramembrane protease [Cyclobacteriaceae bacterium]|nr:CPBP family glutamic-type intramembrane protease [Cyclobacteriaceae bacterium]
MRKIVKLLKSHLHSDFDLPMYATVAVFLAAFITLNYSISLENGIIDRYFGKPIRVLWYFLLYSGTYFSVTLIVFTFKGSFHHFRSPRYWLITLFGLLILAVNVGFPYLSQISHAIAPGGGQIYRWTFGVVNNLINFFIEAIPMFAMAWFFEKKRENFGINTRNVDLKPYWQILMVVFPLVVIASFESGFSNYYPVYRRYEITQANNATGLPPWLFALGFEIAYGSDFFNIEFLFRGLLVIGVSQVIGKEAILPMVGTYCALHFGKPIGECVSSVFGGYILGVVAFYTRNIWGGVIVHVGLAWMMEIVAFIHRNI